MSAFPRILSDCTNNKFKLRLMTFKALPGEAGQSFSGYAPSESEGLDNVHFNNRGIVFRLLLPFVISYCQSDYLENCLEIVSLKNPYHLFSVPVTFGLRKKSVSRVSSCPPFLIQTNVESHTARFYLENVFFLQRNSRQRHLYSDFLGLPFFLGVLRTSIHLEAMRVVVGV